MPDGRSVVDVPLPWDVADLVAYPTNFPKRLSGRPTNVYHVAHNRLRQLAQLGLDEWARTWAGYVRSWRQMPL